ncbi:hypothetical protein BB560_002244 [Smittium megazygosporum]|uniref:DNA helicase n=1 Tax=Smittium megazygosporum TaxID=133381 RepID=A0A2T9ZFA2_9FUNG|nr:hypothetical protein BB560_002244 [Smittium megazygosporum]
MEDNLNHNQESSQDNDSQRFPNAQRHSGSQTREENISSPNLRFTDIPSTPMEGINLNSNAFNFSSQKQASTPSTSRLELDTPMSTKSSNLNRRRHRGDLGFRGLSSLSTPSDMSFPLSKSQSQSKITSDSQNIRFNTQTDSRQEVIFSTGGSKQSEDTSAPKEASQEVRVIWGTMVNVRDVMQAFTEFLENFTMSHYTAWKKQVAKELASSKKGFEAEAEPDTNMELNSEDSFKEPIYLKYLERMNKTEVWQLNLDALHLLSYPNSRILYKQLVNYPEEVIPIMDHVLTEIYMSKYPDDHYDANAFGLKVRPFNLMETKNMRNLDPGDIDKLVVIKGMLIRASPVIPDMEQAFFKCSQCDWTTVISLDKGIIQEPNKCGNIDCGANNTLEIIHNRCTFVDKQICKLQETPDMIPDGQTPHSVAIVLHDEFVDSIKPGDRLEICGVFRSAPVRKNPMFRTIQALFRTFIDVVNIKKTSAIKLNSEVVKESDDSHTLISDAQAAGIGGPEDAYESLNQEESSFVADQAEFRKLASDPRLMDILTHSFAPSIFQMDNVKKGLLLQLFGGERKHLKRTGAPRSRGDIHVLLIGDPGVSKSQLLSTVHSLAPRGIYTSGKGSSAVGLTAYITRDPETRELVLESGALVLSDGGICCIDEFDKMSDSTKSILHEAMEQQTVSITKAGIIATLNARTAILAAANPIESKWNRDMSIIENINLPHSLISRFDLIFIVLDNVDELQDKLLAEHLVSLYIDSSELNKSNEDLENEIPTISTQKLTQYINYARQTIKPIITDEAAQALITAYVEMRKMGSDSYGSDFHGGSSSSKRVTATARQLESMIRMSEAYAKVRLSNLVEESDVHNAVTLMREALRESATDPRTGLIDLDLLNTGFAASDRRQVDAIKMELRKLILSSSSSQSADPMPVDTLNSQQESALNVGLDPYSSSRYNTYQYWFDILNSQSSVPVGSRLFSQVIKELQTEGSIQVSGTGGHATIIPKQSDSSIRFSS